MTYETVWIKNTLKKIFQLSIKYNIDDQIVIKVILCI